MSTIEIHRKKQFLGTRSLTGLDVFVDGNIATSLKHGESKIIQLNPGIHSIHAGKGTPDSNGVVVDTQNSDNIMIEVRTWLYGWKVLFILFYIFSMNNLYHVRIVDKKEHLNTA